MKMQRWTTIILASTLSLGLGYGVAQATHPATSLRYGLLLDNQSYQELALSPTQELEFVALQAQAAQTLDAVRASVQTVRNRLATELTQPQPNLRAVAQLAEQERALVLQQLTALREQRLAFYEDLSPTQQAVIHRELQDLLARFDRIQGLLLRLLGGTA